MTEDEAKTKWCPMVRVGQHGLNTHTNGDIPEMANCIASDCMMWTEQYDFDEEKQEFYINGGYCGLAK